MPYAFALKQTPKVSRWALWGEAATPTDNASLNPDLANAAYLQFVPAYRIKNA